jgi:hypothetical protein
MTPKKLPSIFETLWQQESTSNPMNRANRSPAHPKWKSPCAQNEDRQVAAKMVLKWAPWRHPYCFTHHLTLDGHDHPWPYPTQPHGSNKRDLKPNETTQKQYTWKPNWNWLMRNQTTTQKPMKQQYNIYDTGCNDVGMKWQIWMKQHDTKLNEAKSPLQIASVMGWCNASVLPYTVVP